MNSISSVVIFAVADHSSMGDKTGVTKKIHGQVRGFEENGVKTSFIKRDDNGYVLTDGQKNTIRLSNNPFGYNYKTKNEIALSLLNYYLKMGAPDLLYCRGTRVFGGCKQLFSLFHNNGKLVVIEIPTVTKLFSYRNPKEFLTEIIDRIFLVFMRKYIDAYVVMSHDKKLFGQRTIKINNGIDSERVSLIVSYPHQGIHMLGVAMMQFWHGYERIIEGLHLYYSQQGYYKEDIYFDLVGDGPETSMYKELVGKYNLQDRVIFHGVLHGEDLDEIYNYCDIGVGSFGLYKLKINTISTLKLKEYCAKGIPFIYACPEDSFDPIPYFCKMFSNNSTPVDINEVLNFYHKLKGKMNDVRKDMRLFAEERLSWKKEMYHVIEELEK